jgi:uncharacterized membrane protein YccC
MGKESAIRFGLLAAMLATMVACELTEDQQAAVDACRKHGNASEQCKMANQMLASGSTHIASSIKAQEEALQRREREAAEAAAREQELAAQGVDPCEALRQKLAADHPAPSCADEIQEAVASLKDNPEIGSCAGALNNLAWAADEAANFLGDCDEP